MTHGFEISWKKEKKNFNFALSLVLHSRSILLRRLCSLMGTVFMLRCVTMFVTSLSVPGQHLQCSGKVTHLIKQCPTMQVSSVGNLFIFTSRCTATCGPSCGEPWPSGAASGWLWLECTRVATTCSVATLWFWPCSTFLWLSVSPSCLATLLCKRFCHSFFLHLEWTGSRK